MLRSLDAGGLRRKRPWDRQSGEIGIAEGPKDRGHWASEQANSSPVGHRAGQQATWALASTILKPYVRYIFIKKASEMVSGV